MPEQKANVPNDSFLVYEYVGDSLISVGIFYSPILIMFMFDLWIDVLLDNMIIIVVSLVLWASALILFKMKHGQFGQKTLRMEMDRSGIIVYKSFSKGPPEFYQWEQILDIRIKESRGITTTIKYIKLCVVVDDETGEKKNVSLGTNDMDTTGEKILEMADYYRGDLTKCEEA